MIMYSELKRMLNLTILVALLWSTRAKSIPHDIVVAQDGSGNFSTIASAISAAPNNSKVSYYIHIKAGIYKEYIVIESWKTNLVLIGEGTKRTVITGNRSTSEGIKTFDTATVAIRGNYFTAEHITFENTAGPNMHQAVALRNGADKSAFFKCRFLGYQDTLYTPRGVQFFRDCEILGTVDFIFGNAAVVFQNCLVMARTPLPGQSNTITAQGRKKDDENTGIVLQNCTILGTQDLHQTMFKAKTFFGRPWRIFSRTVIMQSFIDGLIDPQGWLEWDGQPTNNVYYAEYQNRGAGANTSRRVKWVRVLINRTDAEKFTVRNFIHGDGWIPSRIPYSLDLQ